MSSPQWVRVTFVGSLTRDIGDGNPQPVTVDEMASEWTYLALHGFGHMPQFTGDPGPEVRRLLRERLGEGGRPWKAEHQKWLETFEQFERELNGDFRPVDGEKPLNRIELSQLVVDELNLSVTSRAVWKAIKRLQGRK